MGRINIGEVGRPLKEPKPDTVQMSLWSPLGVIVMQPSVLRQVSGLSVNIVKCSGNVGFMSDLKKARDMLSKEEERAASYMVALRKPYRNIKADCLQLKDNNSGNLYDLGVGEAAVTSLQFMVDAVFSSPKSFMMAGVIQLPATEIAGINNTVDTHRASECKVMFTVFLHNNIMNILQ